nr:ribonuclease H-like domain-containing protein [Tanacetum cinerariifolium]
MKRDDNHDGDHPETSNPSPPVPLPTSQIPHTISSIKLFILKKGEYDIWAIKMEHYLCHTNYPIWQVIQNGNGRVSVITDIHGMIKVLPPKTAKEVTVKERERKVRTTLLMALPEDHLAKFHKMADAKEMMYQKLWLPLMVRLLTEEDTENFAMMAYSSSNSGSDNEVQSCSKTCKESYYGLKKLYDEQRDKLGDASVEITAYTLALKKVEA